ncbi:hypothetical protein Pan241w_45040 [Gimesia alba]|uniref:Uncharacterized protein n=1 Tax=Gimesia alba TaxID=2527973 RepID=A0A517RKI8_9PLAN|nr:hypothetical protein Pan241w_45040 [Gimesia alba]
MPSSNFMYSTFEIHLALSSQEIRLICGHTQTEASSNTN